MGHETRLPFEDLSPGFAADLSGVCARVRLRPTSLVRLAYESSNFTGSFCGTHLIFQWIFCLVSVDDFCAL